MLLDAGLAARRLPHGHRRTRRGESGGREAVSRRARTSFGRSPIPIKPDSHLVVLYGNLAPEGAVAKISGKEGLRFTGRARVFDSRGSDALRGDPRRHGRRGRRGRDPLRRPEGRAGHARDAEPDRRHHGPRARRQGRADHRRALLGRQPRLRRRPHHAGSRRRRPDRDRARRRSDRDRRAAQDHRHRGLERDDRPALARVDAAARRKRSAACSRSTRAS